MKTYENPSKFFNQVLTPDQDTLHIASSLSLAKFIKIKSKRALVFTYEQIQSCLFPRWHSPFIGLYLQSKIHQFLIMSPEGAARTKLLGDLDSHLLHCVVFLTELGFMDIQENEALTEEQKLFSQLINQLRNDPELKRYWADKSSLTRDSIFSQVGRSFRRIAVYQMDYVDATRMRFFHLLDVLSFSIVFYVPLSKKYSHIHGGWTSIYKAVLLSKVSLEEPLEGTRGIDRGRALADFLENKVSETTLTRDDASQNFVLTRFQNRHDAFDYSMKNRSTVVSLDAVHARESASLLRTTDTNEQFPLSEYAQSKFFLRLLECDKNKEVISISYAAYFDMMTSGWIHARQISGVQARGFLSDLEVYMVGAQSLTEIKSRLHILQQFHQVGNVFDQMSEDSVSHDQMKKYLTNPFHAFSYFEKKRYSVTLQQLIDLTEKLEKWLHLFGLGRDELVNVASYLQKLTDFMDHECDEDVIRMRLIKKFRKLYTEEDWAFTKNELSQIVLFAMDANSDDQTLDIRAFNQLAGLALSEDSIHIMDFSNQFFPEKKIDFPPYLVNHHWMKTCIQASKHLTQRKKNLLIHCLYADYESRRTVPDQSMYYLFYAVSFRKHNLTISWLDNPIYDQHPAGLIKMLNKIYFKSTSFKQWQQQQPRTEWEEPKELTETPVFIAPLIGKIPDLSWLDYDFCPRKFMYSTVVSIHPVYETDFHQRLLFSTISKLLSQIGHGHEGVINFLFPLFPQWTYTLKMNLMETEYAQDLREYKTFQNISYPVAMKSIQKLRSKYLPTFNWKMKDRYQKNRLDDQVALQLFAADIKDNSVKATPGLHCQMCPYLNVCTEGRYPIDDVSR